MIPRFLRAAPLAAVLGLCLSAFASTNQHVVLITIDGLAAYYLSDPQAPLPTLRRLASEGAQAEGLRVSNPSVTWPNHTTLVTGVHPEKHSVLFNGVLTRLGSGKSVLVDGRHDKTELVAVPTLYDRLHEVGYRTANINWPCTRNAATLDDNFPDVPEQISYTTPRLRAELVSAGILEEGNDANFRNKSAAARDRIWTAAATHIIRERRPNFMLFHMLITDSLQHQYGPQSAAAYTAVGLADAQLAEILQAINAAGIGERTTIFVTSDHGFDKASKIINPNVILRKAGLLRPGPPPSFSRVRAQAISEGGTALVYLTDPETAKEDRAKVIALFREQEGIAEVLAAESFATLHLPDPAKNRQMADLILVPKAGYGFSNEANGEESVTEVQGAPGNQGQHGFLATNPRMNGVFVAWGHGIKAGVKLGLVDNIDIAPTIAALLGEKFPSADGQVLREILR